MTQGRNRIGRRNTGADTPVFTGAPDFSDGADESVEYTYDECGRTLSDLNRGVDSVAYNTVGLPETIHFSDGTYMRQIYLADGRLLRRVTAKGQDAIGGTIGTPGRLTLPGITLPGGDLPTVEIRLTLDTTDYVGPMVFEDGRLARAETPGGFISGDSVYAYVSDHQGNVRQVVNTQTCAVAQETHYYPFGMPFGESVATALAAVNGTALQPRRYGGKESVSLGDLTFLDFPARPYDAALALFLTPDPLQDDYASFSPYLYCMGNPMSYIDPTGMIVEYEGTPEQKEKLKGLITEMRKEESFDIVFRFLEDSKDTFTYKFGEIPPPQSSNGENICSNAAFNRFDNTITLSPNIHWGDAKNYSFMIAEETYHAFQSAYNKFYNFCVNIEYEAQVFAYMHTINLYGGEFSSGHIAFMTADIREKYPDPGIGPNKFINIIDRESFVSSYRSGFDFFFESIKNIKSPYYKNPSRIIPHRLLNVFNFKK